ncbi:MAG: DUF72 domain-containing protein [Ignavibacteriaceae bacterium]|nr:DUF72 domain-containing protein [Ignavibacteriaceae bacterium]
MSTLRTGTCSWKYPSWKGIIYSDKAEQNYLEEYSQHFNTVEIDQWFWSLITQNKVLLPKEDDIKAYTDSVPDDFKFTVKIPNSISLTHLYNIDRTKLFKPNPHFLSAELFNKFLELLEPMGKKIGVLMFQFEYLNRQKMSGLDEFLDKFEPFIRHLDKNYTYGVELRNPNYLKKPFFEFLERNDLAMVFLQGYYMPPIWEVYNECKSYINTTAVIRLHGPDRSSIEEETSNVWDKIVKPKDGEINKIAEIIYSLTQKDVDLYLNVNNHYEGSAPLTIAKLKQQLKM